MSLIAWYPLTKDFKDYSTKKRHFTNYNWDDSKTSEGKFGCALDCTDTLYRINGIPLPTNVKLSEFSISCWFYLTSKSNGNLVNMGENAGFRLRLDGEGSLLAHFATTTKSTGIATVFISDAIFEINEWYNVTVVYKDKKLYTYINNSLNKTSDISSYEDAIVINTGINTLTLGGSIYGSNYEVLKGYLNNVKIYDHALSLEEVKQDYLQPMLHYSFENPYVMETTNIPHSLTLTTDKVTMGTDDIGKYITKPTGLQWYDGLKLSYISVKPGRYYTWSIDIMTTEDCYYRFDTNATCSSAAHTGNDMHFIGGKSIRSSEDIITTWDDDTISTTGKLEAYKWKRAWTTVKIHSECSNPFIWHSISPIATDKSVKMYYKNSMVEESPYPTPYTSSNREAGLIRDNSGMGNDGTQVYQREEIPITPKTQTTSSSVPQYGGYTNVYDSNLKTYTINNFSGADNQTGMLGTIKYLSRYHYLNSKICYEFDIKLQDITVTDGKTIRILQQGPTVFKDDTCRWLSSPVQGVDITSRLNNGATGVYHVCIERIIDNTDCVTNADYYEFGLRFDYVKSGTVTVSNLHAYYGSLDTSTLSLSDNSALGTHSAYFNGKNRINCGVVVPEEMDELTVSCWVYKEDWSTLNPNWSTTGITPSIIGNIDAGGFGLKVENGNNVVNWVTYYKGKGYGPDNPIDCSDFTSGWHLFTGVSTRTKKSLYVDGNIVNSNDITWNAPILSKDTIENIRVNIYIGTEVNDDYFTNLENVYIDDVRLYSTALSPEDIKALYNVKAKIDNKSNLYCNQLVETKSENMMKPLNEIDLDNDLIKVYTSGTFSYKDSIIKYTISSQILGRPGMYIKNSCYGGRLVDNKRYKYSFWVKVSKKGTYFLGEERVGYVTKSLESGKWYYIEREGLATGVNVNFIIYNDSKNYVSGDTIEIRDVQIYRLYDDENYNPGPNIKGQYKTFELNETFNEDVENSGATIVDKYGAEWLEVFYHNTNGDTVWFANESEALHTNSQYKFSILDQLENFRNNNGKFEFLLEYPQDLPGQYNRWKQTDNPAKIKEVINDDTASTIFANGYEAIHIDWLGKYWGGLLRSSTDKAYIDGSVGHTNWYYAIGCYNNTNDDSWSNHLPGPSSSANDIHLYVRIDNLPNKNKIFRQYKRQTKTKEIIEI